MGYLCERVRPFHSQLWFSRQLSLPLGRPFFRGSCCHFPLPPAVRDPLFLTVAGPTATTSPSSARSRRRWPAEGPHAATTFFPRGYHILPSSSCARCASLRRCCSRDALLQSCPVSRAPSRASSRGRWRGNLLSQDIMSLVTCSGGEEHAVQDFEG